MATLTHQESATAEQLVVTDGARRIFMFIIFAGALILGLGILASILGWGVEHHEGAGHAAAAHHEEGHSVLVKRLLVSCPTLLVPALPSLLQRMALCGAAL